MEIVGGSADGFTVKARVLDAPPGVVTETVRPPVVAEAAIMTVAVTWLADELKLLMVMPVDGVKLIALAFARFVPLSVRLSVLPCAAESGASEVKEGAGIAGLTVKGNVLDVPPGVVTETVRAPVAAEALRLTVAVT